MAISNFVPEVWSAAILSNLRNRLIYGNLANRDYEGEIRNAGDTVNITSFVDPSVRSYTKNADTAGAAEGNASGDIPGIQWDLLTDANKQLVVNQANYFAFKVDDIDRRQAIGGFVEQTTRGASYNLAAAADTYVVGEMVSAVDSTSNDLGAATVGASAGDAYDLLVDLRTTLVRSNTPDEGRWVVVPPEFYGVLLKDDRFVRADASGTTDGLRHGLVGRAAGFDVFESNTVPTTGGGAFRVVAGHSWATTYAEQIAKTEALRLENSFSEGVRGLHLFGAEVIRPTLLALADVSVDSES